MYHREKDHLSLVRKMMVNETLARSGIYSRNVLDAIEKVPRHLFLSEALRYRAYEDISLPIGFSQTTSRPSTIARMVQALNLMGDERILEIGTGSGYQTAVIAEIVSYIVTMERIEGLYKRAKDILLCKMGYKNVKLTHNENFFEVEELFDGIIVSAGAKNLPVELLNKLKIHGALVIPIEMNGKHRLFRYIKKSEDRIMEDDLGDAIFVPLVFDESMSSAGSPLTIE